MMHNTALLADSNCNKMTLLRSTNENKMNDYQLLLVLPLFAMALLTFIILFTLGSKRFQAAKSRTMDLSYYKLYQGDSEPAAIRKIARNLENLFEMPVLFYLAIILSIILKLESLTLVFIAWGYVFLRYLHSYIHCTSNRVTLRFKVFLASSVLLLGYWIVLTIKLFSNL
jgi:hypothetical protein